jgi:MFS family permease
MRKIHYAWVICFACLWLFLCNMGLCSSILSVYLPFIEAQGISDSMGSAILSVRSLFSFLATFAVGAYYRKFSLRRGILLAYGASIAAALVFGVGGHILVYYFGAALAGFAVGVGSIYPVSLLASNWFSTHRGLVVGIGTAGSSVATMVFAPVLTRIIRGYSLRTAFLFQAVFLILSAAMVYLLVRDTPEEMGLEAFGRGEAEQKGPRQAAAGPIPRYMMGLLALMMLLNGGVGTPFFGHISVLTITCGYSVETAAQVVSLISLVLMCSKMASGEIADRIGTRNCSVLLISAFILGCFCVLGMNGTDMVWCFAVPVLLGFGSPLYNIGAPLWAGDLAPQEAYADTLRWLQIFYNLGGIIFSMVPGMIADRTGEYKSSYLLFAGMMVVSLSILLWAYHRRTERAHA